MRLAERAIERERERGLKRHAPYLSPCCSRHEKKNGANDLRGPPPLADIMTSSGLEGKLAILESRMSMTAHGFGAPGTPQEFSIGFTERSCPGRTELSSAAEEAHAAAHAMSPGAGTSTSRSPSGSAGKRKRDVTTPIDDGNTTPAFSASSAAVFGSGAATVSPKGRAPAPAAAPAPASEHGQRIQDFFRPKSALAATPSSATAAATSSAPAAHVPAPFTAAPPSSAVGPKASSARRLRDGRSL